MKPLKTSPYCLSLLFGNVFTQISTITRSKILPISLAVIFIVSFAPRSSAVEVTREGGMIPIVMATDSLCFIEGHGRAPDSVVQQRVQDMVDASIVELTGIVNDMPLAYNCIFPFVTCSTKILIKYNPRTPETTRVPLVNALKKGLTYMLDYTFPASNIILAGYEGTANSTDTVVIDSAGANLKYVIKDLYANTDYIIYCPSAWGTDIGCGIDMSLKLMMDAIEGTGGATLEDMYPYFTDTTSPALSLLNYHPVFNGDVGKTCLYMMDLITYSGNGTDVLPGYRIYTTRNITVSDWKGMRFLSDSAGVLDFAQTHLAQKVCSLACPPYVDLGVVNDAQIYEIHIKPPWNILIPAIRLTYPNGGETFCPDSSVTITWKSGIGVYVRKVEILYSTDGGSNWITIADSTANDGIHPWKVPDVNSLNCKIKISDASDGDPFDESNGVFTITSKPSITVTYPNGGETLLANTPLDITWDYTGTVGNVRILFAEDSGSIWYVATLNTFNTGIYPWTVPDVNSSKCMIHICEVSDDDPFDESDGMFTIEQNTVITLLSPNGNEIWLTGSQHDIIWISYGNVGDVRIEYSIDGGSNWKDIVAATTNDGSHPWSIPADTVSNNCKLRVSEALDNDPSDESDVIFGIDNPTSTNDLLEGDEVSFISTLLVVPNPVLQHQEVSFTFTPARAITGGVLKIYDPVGNIIYEIEILDCKADEQCTFGSWDLKNRERRIVECGSYLALLTINCIDGTVDVMKSLIGIKDSK